MNSRLQRKDNSIPLEIFAHRAGLQLKCPASGVGASRVHFRNFKRYRRSCTDNRRYRVASNHG